MARKVREAWDDEMDGRRRGDHGIEDAADDVRRGSEEKRTEDENKGDVYLKMYFDSKEGATSEWRREQTRERDKRSGRERSTHS